jgi:hypothetical protein
MESRSSAAVVFTPLSGGQSTAADRGEDLDTITLLYEPVDEVGFR